MGETMHLQLKNYYYRFLLILGVALSIFATIKTDNFPLVIRGLLQYESMLSLYPLLLLSVCLFVEKIISGQIKQYKPLLVFFIFFYVVNLLIEIHGVAVFKYVKNADYNTLEGVNRIAYQICHKIFHSLDEYSCWAISHILKDCYILVIQFVCSFFVAFSIFLYISENKLALNDISLGCLLALLIVFIYGLFELASFLGIPFGDDVLVKINPYLYEVGNAHSWWPPLLWSGAIRSVFPEPSYFSYWGGIVLVVFIYQVLIRKWIYSIPVIYLAVLLFLTNSRTAVALVLGCICVFTIASVFIDIRTFYRPVLVVLLCIVIAFFSSLFINSHKNYFSPDVSSSGGDMSSSSYIKNTIGTLTSADARSNNSRYGLMSAKIAVGKEQPILGVSPDLIGYYIIDKLPANTDSNDEVQTWVSIQQEKGSLFQVFPALDCFTYYFASGGIVGLILNCFPLIFSLVMFIISFFRDIKQKYMAQESVLAITMIAAFLAFGLSNSWNINYIYFIMLGVIYAIIYEIYKHGKAKNSLLCL